MESRFRRDLLSWLAEDEELSSGLNSIGEEHARATNPPSLAIAASASTDWGAKGAPGREVRVALELKARGDDPGAIAALIDALERRVATMPGARTGYRVVMTQFLRSRAERRPDNMRAVLTEYRFLLLADR